MTEVEASSRNLRRLSDCNIKFQMMLFESVSCLYFSHGITYIAVRFVPVSVKPRLSVHGELLKGDKILRSV